MNESSRKKMYLVIGLLAGLSTSCLPHPMQTNGPYHVTGAYSAYFRPSALRSLAVYVEDHTGTLDGSATLHQVEDEFLRASLDRGYVLAARSDLDRIVQESGLQRNGIIESAAAKTARARGVKGILIVSVDRVESFPYTPTTRLGIITLSSSEPKYRTEVSISARLIDTELGLIVWLGAFHDGMTFAASGNEGQVAPYVAREVASALPSVTSSVVPSSRVPGEITTADGTQSIDRLAVYVRDRSGKLYDDGSLRIVENAVMQTALRKGYLVVTRSDLGTVLTETQFQNSGAVDKALARAGRILGVPAVALVSVDRFDAAPYDGYPPGQFKETVQMSLRLVSTDRASEILVPLPVEETTFPPTHRTDLTFLSFVGERITNALPSRGRAATVKEPASNAITIRGTYSGKAKDSSGPGTLTFSMSQQGAEVTGTVSAFTPSGKVQFQGDVVGTLRGSTLEFTMKILPGGVNARPDCAITMSGIATNVTSNGFTAIYSGTSNCSKPFNDGHLTVTRQ